MASEHQIRILILDDNPKDLEAMAKEVEDAAAATIEKYFGGLTPKVDKADDAFGIAARIRQGDCPWDVIIADVYMKKPGEQLEAPEHGAVTIYQALETLTAEKPFLVMTTGRYDSASGVLTPLVLKQRKLKNRWADAWHKPDAVPLVSGRGKLLQADYWRQLVLWIIASRQNQKWRNAFIAAGLDEIAAASQTFWELKAAIIHLACHDVVAVIGEPGSGKEEVARSLHEQSARRNGTFQPYNCASESPDWTHARIFGAKKGAWTGLTCDVTGLLTTCAKGTVFLDEFGSNALTTPQIEPKLRRLLDPGRTYFRMGDTVERVFTGGLIFGGAHLRAMLLEKGLAENQFSSRIGPKVITVPPLREHPEDILPLARYFLQRYCKEGSYTEKSFSAEAETAMQNYHWPKNIRELQKIIEFVATRPRTVIDVGDLGLPAAVECPTPASGYPEPDTPAGMRLLIVRFRTNAAIASALGLSERRIEQLKRLHRATDAAFAQDYPAKITRERKSSTA